MLLTKILITLVIITAPTLINPFQKDLFIVWNVGQGSWSTYITDNACLHFDMGGEKIPNHKLLQSCLQKHNYAFISHSDWDHISFINFFRYRSKTFCLVFKPTKKWLKNLACKNSRPLINSHLIFNGKKGNRNDQSKVVLFKHILLPGDATKKSEYKWYKRLDPQVKILILGHHGSKTSSSKALLNRLPNLKTAIASARKAKYGHPHKIVTDRLKAKKIPMLSTEQWGHIIFEL